MISFNHPFNKFIHVLELRSPEFLDTDETTLNTSFGTARDGSIWSKKSPATKKFKLTFIELDRKKALETRDFLLLTQDNQETRYFDFNGTSWIGKFINEDFEIETPSRGSGDDTFRREANTIILTFEGRRA